MRKEIREKVHDIINSLNQICVSTSTTSEMLKIKGSKVQDDPGELMKLLEESIEVIEDSNKSAIEAAKMIKNLKKKVYEYLDMGVEDNNE